MFNVFGYNQISVFSDEEYRDLVTKQSDFFLIVCLSQLEKLRLKQTFDVSDYHVIVDEAHEYKDPSVQKTQSLV